MQRAGRVLRQSRRLSAVAVCLLAVTLVMAGCSAGVEAEPDPGGAEPGRTVAGESVEPGTPLRDGFSVVEGSRPLGPALDVPTSVLEFIADYQAPIVPAWRAFLVVEDEPKRVWDEYVAQLTADVAAGGEGGASSTSCGPNGSSPESAQLFCVAFGRTTIPAGGTRNAVLTMQSIAGDVNAGFLLIIDVADENFLGVYPDTPAGLPPWPADQPFPAPVEPSTPPQPGEPLVPGIPEDENYVLLEDSQLVALYGDGRSGLDVLLSVTEDADVDAIAMTYLDQTAGPDGPGCRPAFQAAEALVSTCGPVGGAGGYLATVIVVDRMQGEDYLLYEAHND